VGKTDFWKIHVLKTLVYSIVKVTPPMI